MKLLKESCYNPFFTDVNCKRYEITNIIFFDRSGVICETGRGWFASEHGGSNNDFKNGLELPTECTVKRKADFSADAAFIIKHDSEGYIYSKARYALYIPAAAVGLKAPTVRRPEWDKRHFELTYKSDIPGVCAVVWHFVDAPLKPITDKICKVGESLKTLYNATPDRLAEIITELSALEKEYSTAYAKMLAITPEQVLQARRAQ